VKEPSRSILLDAQTGGRRIQFYPRSVSSTHLGGGSDVSVGGCLDEHRRAEFLAAGIRGVADFRSLLNGQALQIVKPVQHDYQAEWLG
jgi:hypothetical protein